MVIYVQNRDLGIVVVNQFLGVINQKGVFRIKNRYENVIDLLQFFVNQNS